MKRWLIFMLPILVAVCAGCRHLPLAAEVNFFSPPRHSGYHHVRVGETVASIARQYHRSMQQLIVLNRLKPPYTIFPGEYIALGRPIQRIQLRRRGTQSVKSPRAPSNIIKKISPTNKYQQDKHQSAKNHNTYRSGRFIETHFSHLTWQWPAKGPVIGQFVAGGEKKNNGIEISANLGAPVRAAASGRVVYSGSGLTGYGQLIIIKHSNIYLSAYAHNRKLIVKEGDRVKIGQKIAEMGRRDSNHIALHFEIRKYGRPVNPLWYLPK